MTRTRIPDEILTAAHARATARRARDWDEADRIRAVIESAGWRIVDRGTDFALSPAAPLDLIDGGRTRYGSTASVPSRLTDLAEGIASVVVIATDWPDDLTRAVAGLRTHAPSGTSIVVVADAPTGDQEKALDALEGDPSADAHAVAVEIVWTSERLGHAAATNTGVRRARGPVVVLLDTSVEPTGDIVTPLVSALADETVAVVGGWGTVSSDLRRFRDAPPGDVDAIEGSCQAFRRADFTSRGPLDERFRVNRNLDIWWSFVLRDEGEEHPPRRAVRLDGLPVIRHEHRVDRSLSDVERDRQGKRNFYRIFDRFGSRTDLLIGGPREGSG